MYPPAPAREHHSQHTMHGTPHPGLYVCLFCNGRPLSMQRFSSHDGKHFFLQRLRVERLADISIASKLAHFVDTLC